MNYLGLLSQNGGVVAHPHPQQYQQQLQQLHSQAYAQSSALQRGPVKTEEQLLSDPYQQWNGQLPMASLRPFFQNAVSPSLLQQQLMPRAGSQLPTIQQGFNVMMDDASPPQEYSTSPATPISVPVNLNYQNNISLRSMAASTGLNSAHSTTRTYPIAIAANNSSAAMPARMMGFQNMQSMSLPVTMQLADQQPLSGTTNADMDWFGSLDQSNSQQPQHILSNSQQTSVSFSADSPITSAFMDGDDLEPNTKNLHMLYEKRRRRRESHNAVERRRRDHINDRISDMSQLLPESYMCSDPNAKPNKGQILRKAVEYIQKLQNTMQEMQDRSDILENALLSLGVEIPQSDTNGNVSPGGGASNYSDSNGDALSPGENGTLTGEDLKSRVARLLSVNNSSSPSSLSQQQNQSIQIQVPFSALEDNFETTAPTTAEITQQTLSALSLSDATSLASIARSPAPRSMINNTLHFNNTVPPMNDQARYTGYGSKPVNMLPLSMSMPMHSYINQNTTATAYPNPGRQNMIQSNNIAFHGGLPMNMGTNFTMMESSISASHSGS